MRQTRGARVHAHVQWIITAIAFGLASVPLAAHARGEQWTMTVSFQHDSSEDHDETDALGYDRTLATAHMEGTATLVFEVVEPGGATVKSARLVKITGSGSSTSKRQHRYKRTDADGEHTTTIVSDATSQGSLDASKTTSDECSFLVGTFVTVSCKLHFHSSFEGHTKKTLSSKSGGSKDYPFDEASTAEDGFTVVLAEPASPQMIRDRHWTVSHVDKQSDPAMGSQSTITQTADVRGGAREEVELVVEPDDYDSWLPQADLATPASAGSKLVVRARLKTKSGKPVPADMLASRIVFKLANGSHLPGVATNFPAGDTDGSFDLKIVQRDNLDELHVDPGEQSAAKRGPTDVAVATISAFDFGGWSDLVVTAELADGTPLIGHLAGKPEGAIPLPRRSGDSKIADAWRKSKDGSKGPDDADDDAQPVGNGFAGDGFTNFEEYRGIVCGWQHVRMKPGRKDLLVRVAAPLDKDAGPGLGYFKAGTGLEVHVCTSKRELPDSREVTSNHGEGAHRVNQHGVVIELDASSKPGGAVENIGTPATAGHIVLTAPPAASTRERLEWDATVAHELGHAININHHGDADRTPVFWVQRPDGTFIERARERTGTGSNVEIRLLDENGKPVTLADPDLAALFSGAYSQELYIQLPHGEHSGAENCFMRYSRSIKIGNRYLTILQDVKDPAVRRVIHAPEPVGTGLCATKQGTGENAPGHRPLQWHAEAQRGNCVHAFVVNDAYGAPDPE